VWLCGQDSRSDRRAALRRSGDAMGRLHRHRCHLLDLVTPTPGRTLFGPAVTISAGKLDYDNLASARVGSNNSTGLPEGSSSRICLPPTPLTISLRKCAPASRNS
jgi:hypothetical protein